MIRTFAAALPAMTAALAVALPAAAREPTVPVLEEIVVANKGWSGGRAFPAELTEEEIAPVLRRLPTLAQLAKERWSETHRRFDSRRGRERRGA